MHEPIMRPFGLISYLFLIGMTSAARTGCQAMAPGSLSRLRRGALTLAIAGKSEYGRPSPRFRRQLSVTEGDERSRRIWRSVLSRFRLADWIVPPLIVPLFLLLLVLAAALLR